jgi:Uma2 family endonuclease
MADVLDHPPHAMDRQPVRWTVTQFHNMCEHGLFRDQKMMLIHGRILEKYPEQRVVRWTREQYRKLAALGFLKGLRTELIYGEIYQMSPMGWPHVIGCNKTADVLRGVFRGIGWINPEHPFAADESDPEPDVSVIPGRMEDYTDHPTQALLVVEVSDTTLTQDTTTKAELYATAGIPDYWVLDVDGRRLLVFRDPVPLPQGLGGTAYRTHLTIDAAGSVSPLAAPTATVRVADLLP